MFTQSNKGERDYSFTEMKNLNVFQMLKTINNDNKHKKMYLNKHCLPKRKTVSKLIDQSSASILLTLENVVGIYSQNIYIRFNNNKKKNIPYV